MVDTWHNEKIGTKVVEALKKNNFDAIYFADRRGSRICLGICQRRYAGGLWWFYDLKELGLPKRVEEKGATL